MATQTTNRIVRGVTSPYALDEYTASTMRGDFSIRRLKSSASKAITLSIIDFLDDGGSKQLSIKVSSQAQQTPVLLSADRNEDH